MDGLCETIYYATFVRRVLNWRNAMNPQHGLKLVELPSQPKTRQFSYFYPNKDFRRQLYVNKNFVSFTLKLKTKGLKPEYSSFYVNSVS